MTKRDPIQTLVSLFSSSSKSKPEFCHNEQDLFFVLKEYENALCNLKNILATRLIELDYNEVLRGSEVVAASVKKAIDGGEFPHEVRVFHSIIKNSIDAKCTLDANTIEFPWTSLSKYFEDNYLIVDQESMRSMDVSGS